MAERATIVEMKCMMGRRESLRIEYVQCEVEFAKVLRADDGKKGARYQRFIYLSCYGNVSKS
jgi:hypothetical protein